MILAATEDLLGVLKWALLALLYLFFARVLWAVWSEVRVPRGGFQRNPAGAHPVAGQAPTVPAPRPTPAQISAATRGGTAPGVTGGITLGGADATDTWAGKKPKKGKHGQVGRLVVTEPKVHRGLSYAVSKEITVGRNETCDIPMPDDTYVSGLHARFYRDAGALYVDDLGSTNGTYLNGSKVTTPMPLTPGDSVQIGRTILEAE